MSVESSEHGVAKAQDGPAGEVTEAVASETVAVTAPEGTELDPSPSASPAVITPPGGAEAAVSSWPFIGYGLVWALFAAFVVWRLLATPLGQPVFESGDYALTVGLGLTLTCAGPLTILAVWLLTPREPGAGRGPLLYSSLMKGSLAMLAGVCLWWAALIIIDQLRMGRIF